MNVSRKENDAEWKKGGVDWEELHRRIAEVEETLASLDDVTSETAQQIWARRAAQLAESPVEEDETKQIELVLLRLGKEFYGVEVRYVSEITMLNQITRVPRVPDWVAGVFNLRGRILSAIDLSRFFGLERGEGGGAQPEESPYLVIVEQAGIEVALLVDDVLAVGSLPSGYLQDATGTVRGLRPEYVRGVAEYGGSGPIMVVLNLPALLSDSRLIIHEEMV